MTAFKKLFLHYPLIQACVIGNVKLCILLLTLGVNIDAGSQCANIDTDGETPLMFAIHNQHKDIVEFLLEKDADILKASRGNISAVMECDQLIF